MALDCFYRRLWEVLNGIDKDDSFTSLAAADRKAILSILRKTKADLPSYWQKAEP